MKNLHTGLGQRTYTTDTVLEMNSLSKMTGLEYVYCNETNTLYSYVDSLVVPDNGTSVLSTIDGGDTRWVGIAGTYAYYAGAVLSNEIVINQIEAEIPGIQHQTFASAFTWIAANSPATLANPWTVRFTGTVVEDIVIPEHVSIVGEGKDNSTIDGEVKFESTGSIYSNTIYDCEITKLTIDGTTALPTTPPMPILYSTGFTPTTYEYGLDSAPAPTESYDIVIDYAGTVYTITINEGSDDVATVQATIRAHDPLFSEVVVTASNPGTNTPYAGDTFTITLHGAPSGFFDYGSGTIQIMPNYAASVTTEVLTDSIDNVEHQFTPFPYNITTGNIELKMDYTRGGITTTYTTGIIPSPFNSNSPAGLANLYNDIATDYGMTLLSALASGTLTGSGLDLMLAGFPGAAPTIYVEPGTYDWEASGYVAYHLYGCRVIEVQTIGTDNIGLIEHCEILGGDMTGHLSENLRIGYSELGSSALSLQLSNRTYLDKCILSDISDIIIEEGNLNNCTIYYPAGLVLNGSTRVRHCYFAFGSLVIPAGANVKSFGCFYINVVTIQPGGNLTSHGDILEGFDNTDPNRYMAVKGLGTWNSLVGTSYDPNTMNELFFLNRESQRAIDELCYSFYDDFLGVTRAEWQLDNSDGVTTFTEKAGGWVRDTATGGSASGISYNFGNYRSYDPANLKAFSANVLLESIDSIAEFGLYDHISGAYIKIAYNGTGLTDWFLRVSDGTSEEVLQGFSFTGIEDKFYVKFRTSTVLEFYQNDEYLGELDISALTMPSLMEPYRSVVSTTASDVYMEMDYFKIWQKRA